MKKKLISTLLLLAMILSRFIPFSGEIPTIGGETPRDKPTETRSSSAPAETTPGKPPNKTKPPVSTNPDEVSKITELQPLFSHEAGFYSESFNLTLTVPEGFEGAEIYYTTSDDATGVTFPRSELNRHDGGLTPTVSSTRYTAPIQVSVPSEVNVFTVSAIAVLNGEVSPPFTHSFVRGTNVNSRFGSDFAVFSLYSDANGLFDFNDGILVPGIDRQEWIDDYKRINNSTPDPWRWDDQLPPTSPANFNRRGKGAERAVHVEMFDAYGTRHISQDAGMRVKGGWSRGTFIYEQRTLELYARNSYGDGKHFLYPLFGEQHSEDGNLMHRYRRFLLRNGGSDREQSYLRDELSHELYRLAGFPDVQEHRPAAVFLNGEYYGLVFLKSSRNENHLYRKYGGEEDGFELIGGNERGRLGCERKGCGRVLPGEGVSGGRTPAANPVKCDGKNLCGRGDCETYWSLPDETCEGLKECRATADWAEIRKAVQGSGGEETPNGLDKDADFERFCQRVDIDNLIQYYALGIYIANVDWPGNNVEMWRYFATPDEDLSALRPELADGKWRFYTKDVEFAYGLWSGDDTLGPRSGTRATDNTIRALINRTGVPAGGGHFNATHQTFIIPALMRRDDMKAKLANALIDVMEGAYKPENALAVFNNLRTQIEAEHKIMLNGSSRRITEIDRDNNRGNWPDWNAIDRSHGQIRDFLERRPAAVLEHIKSELGFDASDRAAITFKNGSGGEAVMNTRPVGEGQTVTGNYYNKTSLSLTAKPYRGYAVDYWTVDGVKQNGSTITVNVAKPLTVEVHYTKCPVYAATANLHISAVKSKNRDGFIELTNDTGRSISTEGLFLSDIGKDLHKFELPEIEIPAGESVRFSVKGNADQSGDFAAQVNFNLSFGERLYLSDYRENTLQRVEISRMGGEQTQILGNDGKWRIDGAPEAPPPKPDNPGSPSNPSAPNNPDISVPPVLSGGVTAVPGADGNSVAISGIPESGSWSVSINVDVWPPTGGPWGIPDGVSVSYKNGVLTISGNGRHGWGDNWNMTWGFW